MMAAEETAPSSSSNDLITVGRLVEVASRTWPGINKPGGVARVINVHYDKDASNNQNGGGSNDKAPISGSHDVSGANSVKTPTHVDVKYILGGSREKRVPVEYVKLAPQYESTSVETEANGRTVSSTKTLRDRSMMLGRCRRCGSLRKDCGSCDWATEESEAKKGEDKAKSASTTAESKTTQQVKNDPFSSSDDDDDNDDGDIQKLIRHLSKRHGTRGKKEVRKNENQSAKSSIKRRRRFTTTQQQESSLVAATVTSKDTLNKKRSTTNTSQAGQKDSLSSSDDGLADSRHKRRLLQKRYQTYSGLSGYSAMASLDFPSSSSSSSSSEDETIVQLKRKRARIAAKRVGTEGYSVLESLPSTSRARRIATRETHSTYSKTQGAQRHDNEISFPDADTDESEQSVRQENKKKVRQSKKMVVGVALYSDPSTTEDDRMEIPFSEKSHIDRQLLALEARARNEMVRNQQQNENGDLGAIDGDFIQPEGEEAIENLPSDMVDLSKSLPYKELARFFDKMAARLEDETIPDFTLKVARLQRELREKTNPRTSRLRHHQNSVEENVEQSLSDLLKQCDSLWAEVHASVIRNGTDQCSAALRRLMDDRLYRKNKKQLTSQQRRLFRGSGAMEARNLRMDAIEESVEDVVHRLKSIAEQCEEQVLVEADDNKEDAAASHFSSDSTISRQDDKDPSQPLAELSPRTGDQAFNKRSSNHRFDPHQNSSKVRHTHHEHPSRPSRTKRRPHTDRHEANTKKRHRVAVKRSMSNSDAAKDASSELSYSSDVPMDNDVTSSFDNDEDLVRNNDKSEFSSTFDFEEADERVKIRRGRKRDCVCGASTKERHFKTASDRSQSISQRMQAFLDANSGNDIAERFDQRPDEVSLRPDWRSSRGQSRRNRNDTPNHDVPMSTAGEQHRSQKQKNPSRPLHVDAQPCNIKAWPITAFQSNFSSESNALEGRTEFSNVQVNIDELENSLSNIYSMGSAEFSTYMHEIECAFLSVPLPHPSFLDKMRSVLASGNGARTIREVLVTSDADLHRHVRFLAYCVRLSGRIERTDRELPFVFGRAGHKHMMVFMTLQLLDTLFSVFLPLAWGTDNDIDMHSVLSDLVPLRDALCDRMNLLECVCRCLVETFPCQQWKRSVEGSRAFISSVDPMSWREFVESGTIPKNPEITRFANLGDIWPRNEIQSHWRILAFISGAQLPSEGSSEGSSTFRWQVVSKLCSAGNLAVFPTVSHSKLPCSPEHLCACHEEISCFASLISSGIMNCLPKTDSMLINLIRRSIILQSETYAGDESARLEWFRSLAKVKGEKKQSEIFWRFTDVTYLSSVRVHPRRCLIFDMTEAAAIEDGECGYRNILRPSSKLVYSCLALLAEWAKNVPQKKARRARLIKAVEALCDALTSCAQHKSRDSQPPSCDNLSFETAFGEKLPVENGCGASRAASFLKETSALLRIFGSGYESSDLTFEIWNMIADHVLKERQLFVIGSSSKRNRFEGDPYTLLSNAKTMATVVFLQMKISPWHPSLGKNLAQIESLGQENGESIFFGLSCIFACLDCMVDMEIDVNVFSHFFKIIVLTFQAMTTKIKVGSNTTAFDHNMKSMCLRRFVPVLARCTEAHLSAQTSSRDGLHFRYLLSTIRSIQCFVAMNPDVTQAPNLNENSPTRGEKSDEDESMWGGIDDSLFASLEMESFRSEYTDHRTDAEELQLWKILSNAVEMSKPSDRFAIVDSTQMTSCGALMPSTFGRFLVAKEMCRICDCLSVALALANKKETHSEVKALLLKWIYPPNDDSEDADYFLRASKRLAAGICSLTEQYPNCQSFAMENADALLFSFIDSLCDSRRLELFPSCNLDTIRENGGESGLEQALALLDLLNDETLTMHSQSSRLRQLQQRRKEKAAEIWIFCKNLGKSLLREKDVMTAGSLSRLGHALLHTDDDLLQLEISQTGLISLEKESFRVVRFLRNLISRAAESTESATALVERVGAWSLVVLVNQILAIVRSLKYHDQCATNLSRGSEQAFQGSTLTNLLSCYIEIFVSVLTWLLREVRHDGSDCWRDLTCVIRDTFLSPILRRQLGDTSSVLHGICSSAKSVLDRFKSRDQRATGIHGCAKYFREEFLQSTLRRSKQILMASALNSGFSSLHNAMLESVLNAENDNEDLVAWKVGSSFPLPSRRPRKNQMWSYKNPLHQDVDGYFDAAEEILNGSMDADDRRKVHLMKQSFLTIYIIPRLCHRRLELDKKRRVLKLLSYFLECHAKVTPSLANVENPLPPLLDFNSVCATIKGLTLNIRQCLVQDRVDEGLFNNILVCATYLANASVPIDGCWKCLMEWSAQTVEESSGKSMVQLNKGEVDACYVWIFFQWLHCITTLVIKNNDEFKVEISSLRECCREAMDDRGRGLGEEPLDIHSASIRSEQWQALLVDFESFLFPSKAETVSSAINIYAKSSTAWHDRKVATTSEEEPMETWRPTPAVRRSAKEFIAAIVATS